MITDGCELVLSGQKQISCAGRHSGDLNMQLHAHDHHWNPAERTFVSHSTRAQLASNRSTVMSRQTKWVGVILFLAGMATGTDTGMAVGTPYVLAAVNQHGSNGAVA